MANAQLLASDSFISGSLAAGWSAVSGLSTGQVIAGSPNVVEPVAINTNYGQIWTGLVWPNDQASEITVNALTTAEGSYVMLLARMQSGSRSGYQANIQNGASAQIFRYDNGVATQVGSNTASLTVNTGDVFVFQAAGGFLCLYQNNNRVFYNADPTYPSGSPGFQQFSSVDITHTKVASWRGYNAVQQDGIWTKKGIAVPLIAGDLAGGGDGVFTNSIVLQEGNAQVLSGTVYKTWLSTAFNIQYAESLDGITWTRLGSPVLSSFVTPAIIKNGSTYYMYCQPSAQAGSGNFALYTSSDGVNWAQQSNNVIGLGGVGAWDHAFIWSFNPIAIINGTWYAVYAAGSDNIGFQFSVGLATSPDGLTWTKYAGNPVIAKGYVGQGFAKVGSTYYLWVAPAQPGQGQSHPNEVPTEATRYQSTDLINWTNPIKSIHHSEIFENVNGVFGQAYFNSIIDIGGKAYGYTTVSLSDSSVPLFYQVGLAVAGGSIAQIVTAPEDAASQIATDAFTSGIGNLSSNWVTPTGTTKLQIVAGNLVEASVINTNCFMCFSGSPFSSDQYSEVTLTTLGSGNEFISPIVRAQTGVNSWYGLTLKGPTGSAFTTCSINRTIAGSATQLGPNVTVTPQVGDVYRLQVIGNVISFFQNGFLILQVEDPLNTLTSGFPGMGMFSAVLASDQVSLWNGGNANVIPAYPNIGGASSSWFTIAFTNSLRGLRH